MEDQTGLPLTVIVSGTYKRDKQWEYIENCLKSVSKQIYPNYMHILISNGFVTRELDEKIRVLVNLYNPKRARFFGWIPYHDDWGHLCRHIGAQMATMLGAKYVCWYNDDDYTHEDYLEKMVARAEKEEANAVICWVMNHKINRVIKGDLVISGEIDAGQFLVNAGLASRIGWTSKAYEGDYYFIKEFVDNCGKTEYIEEILYEHR